MKKRSTALILFLTTAFGGCTSLNQELVSSAMNGNMTGVVKQIRAGADINGRAYDKDITALHAAVTKNQMMIVQYLVGHGAKVDAKDSDGRTPLTMSIVMKYMQITEYLLQQGADPQVRDNRQATLLHYAVIADNDYGFDRLLQAGLDINAVDQAGVTPLHLAVMLHKKEMVALILKKNPDLTIRDDDNKLAADYARDLPDMARFFPEAGQ